MQNKIKNKLTREFFTFHWLQNNITLFCEKSFNKQHQVDIWFKEQQFLVLTGVKNKNKHYKWKSCWVKSIIASKAIYTY